MFGILLALLILDGLLLTVVVLLQSGKGGGLAAMGGVGTETFIGGRQAATILTKASWIMGGIFMGLAFVLAVMSTQRRQPESILRGQFQQAPATAPQPLLPGAQPQGQEGDAATQPQQQEPATPPATPGEQQP
ncbi:MAG TPA: preprotein translocase subunit SecG [Longimicrobiales bacterium]